MTQKSIYKSDQDEEETADRVSDKDSLQTGSFKKLLSLQQNNSNAITYLTAATVLLAIAGLTFTVFDQLAARQDLILEQIEKDYDNRTRGILAQLEVSQDDAEFWKTIASSGDDSFPLLEDAVRNCRAALTQTQGQYEELKEDYEKNRGSSSPAPDDTARPLSEAQPAPRETDLIVRRGQPATESRLGLFLQLLSVLDLSEERIQIEISGPGRSSGGVVDVLPGDTSQFSAEGNKFTVRYEGLSTNGQKAYFVVINEKDPA